MNQQLFDDSTLIRIFALHELHNLKDRGLTRGALNDYHSRYKLVFLAHSQPEYRKLGPFVADIPACLHHFGIRNWRAKFTSFRFLSIDWRVKLILSSIG